jgi:hypothetical protein
MTGYIDVMLVLQSCTDPLHILAGSSGDTYATSSDSAYHIGNMEVEKGLDMQEEEGAVNVKTAKGIGIKEEEDVYSEEEEKEVDVDTKEEDVDIKEEVSLEGTV